MRQHHHIKRTLVFLSIFCAILLPASGMAGSLLCIGDAGHIGIEFFGTCTNLTPAGDRNNFLDLENPQQSDCGTCIDIPLNAGPFLQTSFQSVHTHAESLPVLAPPCGSINPTYSKYPSNFQPDYSGDHLSTFPIDVLRI